MYGSALEAKHTLERLLELRVQLAKKNGIAFYRPHPKQQWFHSHGDYRYRYARTGNRFGKSDMGTAEDCAFALGYRPWIPEGDPDRYKGIPKKATVGMILCTDWKKATEVFTGEEEGTGQGKLFKFLPADSIFRVGKTHGNIDQIVVKSIWGGYSVIKLDTIVAWKQNNQRAESSSYDWLHVDEPVPKRMFEGYARGLMDRNGKVWFTCTPICEPWINSFFQAHRRSKIYKDRPNYHGKDRVLIVGNSFDNPYNSVEGMKSYAEVLDAKMAKARIEGEPVENTGVIYYMFSEDHLYYGIPDGWEAHNKPPKHYTIRYHLDCHPSTPHAVIFSATSPQNVVYFFDEIWLQCDPETLADQIKEITKGYFVSTELCDPSCFNKQMDKKTVLAEILLELGLCLEKGAKDPKRGIIEFKALLNTPGKIKISNQMVNFLEELDTYSWDNPEKRPDKPVDKNDHFIEGAHRLAINGLEFIDQSIFESRYGRSDGITELLSL